MQVDVGEMRSGANRSYQAADRALDGANALSRVGLNPGMFGTFEAAETFLAGVHEAHLHHVTRMNEHSGTLGSVGDRAMKAASSFADMEERNTEALREVRWPTIRS